MKLSEILKVAKPYHVAFGGIKSGMCGALMRAHYFGEVTDSQEVQAISFCMEFVKSIHGNSFYLNSALAGNGLPNDNNTIALIWDAVIDKLEEDGK